MTLYLATTAADAARMRATRRLRTLVGLDGRPCGCRVGLRLWRTPALAVAHPNARGVPDVLLTIEHDADADMLTLHDGLRVAPGDVTETAL